MLFLSLVLTFNFEDVISSLVPLYLRLEEDIARKSVLLKPTGHVPDIQRHL